MTGADIKPLTKPTWVNSFFGAFMIPINEYLIYKFRKMGGGITRFVIVTIMSIRLYLLGGGFVIWLCGFIPKHVVRIPLMGGVTIFVMIGIVNFETILEVPIAGSYYTFIFLL